MSETPQISIIMPVFNGERFVADAIRSALAQNGSFEIVLHDDGSSDGTLALLQRFCSDEARLSMTSGPNRGPAASRNRCLDRARGEMIAFLDHDDLWPAGRLERQFHVLAAKPSAGLVLGHTWIFEELDRQGQPATTARSRRLLTGLLQAGLFRRAALDCVGGFDTSLAAADDFDVLLRLRESPWSIEIDPDVAVYYRLHEAQWTANTRFAASQTVRALHRSLSRRRQDGTTVPLKGAGS